MYLISIPAKEVLTVILNFLGNFICNFKRMDGETTNKLEVLETIDICYLVFNTMTEFLGMNHIAAFLLNSSTERRLATLGAFNGPFAFIMVMVLNDIIYYPCHCIAHKRLFYPYVHKQHHLQFVPFRGYYDAANQNPIEQVYGFAIFIGVMHLTLNTIGLHSGTAWCCTLSWAILNISNHLPFDSSIHLPVPYPAFPRDHQMHHRIPTCNYSTLSTMMDRFCGSYKPFKQLGEQSAAPAKKPWYENRELFHDDTETVEEADPGRPEAFPSPWSVVGMLFSLVLAVTAVEVYYLGGSFPPAKAFAHVFKAVIVSLNLAIMCAATESAALKPQPVTKFRRQDGRPTGLQESMMDAVPKEKEHVKKAVTGDKTIFKEKFEPEIAKPFRRELKTD
jgi:sterol desaturase/sphingolipid hydroxylase (fatty acid hydroxylase superfamily)